MADEKFGFKLKGKTAVFIDWANVYGWRKSLKAEVNPKKLYHHLRGYKEVRFIGFYHGTDKHEKSRQFLKKVKSIGFSVVTKEVKYIPVSLDSSHFRQLAKEAKYSLNSIKNLDPKDIEKILKILNRRILRRKCDFDIEISMDVHKLEKDFLTFIFFSGDGDFAPLMKYLIGKKKQVIVVYASGHIGREIWEIKRGIFKVNIENVGL